MGSSSGSRGRPGMLRTGAERQRSCARGPARTTDRNKPEAAGARGRGGSVQNENIDNRYGAAGAAAGE